MTEGTRLLWSAIEKKRWSQNRLADELAQVASKPLHSGTVNRWLHGTLTPSLTWVLAIQKLLGIPAEAFTRPPRKMS